MCMTEDERITHSGKDQTVDVNKERRVENSHGQRAETADLYGRKRALISQ